MKELTPDIIHELENDFMAIQMPRTPFTLNKLIVGARYTEPQKRAQMVLEMSIAYDNLRTAKCKARLKELEIEEMIGNDEKTLLEKEIKQVELDQLNRARLGALREFEYLFNMWEGSKKYTREELNINYPKEMEIQLKTQALHDYKSNGRVSVGNLEGLRQIGVTPDQIHLELGSNKPILRDEVEKQYLEEGKLRCLCIIPSKDRLSMEHIDSLLKDIDLPTNIEFRIENISGSTVDNNYNSGFEKAINEGCTHVLTLEHDQVLQKDSIIRLFDFALNNQDSCVGAWYPKRQETRQGVHIKLSGGHRRFLDDDGGVHEVKTLAMGLSIYPTRILKEINFPRCKTTDSLSQDSYMSQKLRDKGYKLLVDTNIKIGHKDLETGKIYY